MAHPLECPSCHFTTRVADELFEKKVRGRRVKVPCKGCRQPMIVDATSEQLTIAPYSSRRPSQAPASTVPVPAPSWEPVPPPSVRARAFDEEELPTLRRNEIPVDESFLPPVAGSDPPPTSWPQTIPPLGGHDSLGALLAPAPRSSRARRGALALVAVCLLSAGAWATYRQPAARQWMAGLLRGGEEEVMSSSGAPATFDASSSARSVEEPATVAATASETSSDPETEAPKVTLAVHESASSAAAPTDSVASPRSESRSSREEPKDGGSQGVSAAPVAAATRETPADPSAAQGAGVVARPLTGAVERSAEAGEESAPLAPFDRAAATTALQVAEGQAAACRSAGDPSGTARVVVTFAPSGRVTSAVVAGPPFAGTPTGGCIASRFRAARVPAFEGSYVTVAKTVVVQ